MAVMTLVFMPERMIDEVDPATGRRLLDAVVERRVLATDGKSGAVLERVRLADGRVLVVKHIDVRRDWIMRATGDTGRVARLWSDGVLAGLPAVIDHTIVAVEPEGDGWVVTMDDVSGALFADDRRLSRAESRRLLAAATELHRAFRGRPAPEGLTPLAELYRFLSPQAARHGAIAPELAPLAQRGWVRFGELVPVDVAAGVARVHRGPETFAEALCRHVCTLVHGDLKRANLGFTGDRVVVLDWGSLTTWAPAEVDFAWYVAVNGAAVDATHDELVADASASAGADLDEDALRLALLGALAQLGWEKALGAADADDGGVRARERDGLAWWCARAREGLEVWTAAG